MKFTVAIDGPAAAGKGTIARALAAQFGFGYLDTGLLYRAVARKVLDGADAVQAAQRLRAEDIDEKVLRTPEVAQAASRVAADPDVRSALVAFQRAFARREGGAVLDGRDIGTVICPDAEVKLFVTASDDVRIDRRFAELQAKGIRITRAQVARDLCARDRRDAERASAPMKRAADARVLDTTDLTADEALARARAIVATALAQG